MVMWCDMATNIYGSSEFINYDNIDDYYKDNTAYMDVILHRQGLVQPDPQGGA